MTWKYCFVLSCLNNSKKNPEKYYYRVPYNKSMRDKWCLAVDRSASSIKQSSTAYCCSDHFDMEEDLDRFASSSGSPKLKDGVIPSLKHIDTQARNAKALKDEIEKHNFEMRSKKIDRLKRELWALEDSIQIPIMEVIDIFGPDVLTDESTTKDEQRKDNVYIREVVYIEENDNDQFLQENVESEMDCLNVGPEMEHLPTQSVIEISDDKNLLGAVATAIKSFKPKESLVKYKIPPKSLVSEQRPTDKNKDCGVASLKSKQCKLNNGNKGIINQSNVVLKQDKGPLTVNTKHSKFFECKDLVKFNNKERISTLPGTEATMKYNKSQPLIGIEQLTRNTNSTYQIKNVLSTSTAKPTLTVASKPLLVHNSGSPGIEILPKQSVVNRFKYTNYKEFTKLQNQHKTKKHTQSDDDDCILLDEQNVASPTLTTNHNSSNKLLAKLPSSISVKEFSGVQMAPSSMQPSKAIVRIQPQPILRVREFGKVNDAQDVNYDKEFKLIQLIISENPSLVTCNKTNRIKISRTKPNEFKILDNTYYYRTNEIYEKNYFFMNITQISRHYSEIIQRNYGIYWGDPRVSCVGVVETKGVLDEQTKNFVFQQVKKSLFDEDGQQHVKLINVLQQPIKPILLRRSAVPENIPATIKSISIPTNEIEIINLDEEVNNYDTIINFTEDGPTTTILNSIGPPLNNTKNSSSHQLTGISTAPEVSQDEHQPNSDLINLYKYLSPAMRKLINKLKYFEMYNGIVYTVTVGPKFSSIKDKPFNLIFTKNSKGTNVKVTPKELHVSKLVNDIFRAIYPNPLCKQSINLLKRPPILPKTINANNSISAITAKKEKIKKSPSKALNKAVYYDMTQNVKILTPSDQAKVRSMSSTMPIIEKIFKLSSGETIKIAKAKPNTKMDSIEKSIKTPTSLNITLNSIPSMQISNVSQPTPASLVSHIKKPLMVAPTSPLRCSKTPDVRDEVTPKVNTQLCVMLPSTQTNNSPTDKSRKHKDNKKRHICCFCKAKFERSYQLKRHLFVRHNFNKTSHAVSEATNNNSPSALVLSINYTPQDKLNPESPGTPSQETFTNDIEMKSIIKTEKDEDTYLNEKSLLVPLFEVPAKTGSKQPQNCQDDFLLVKCKEEPEEHIEEITEMPVFLANQLEPPEQRGRKRKAIKKRREQKTSEIPSKFFDEESKKQLHNARKHTQNYIRGIRTRPAKSRPTLSKQRILKRKAVEKYLDEETDSAPESSVAKKYCIKNYKPKQRKRANKIVKRSRQLKKPKVNKRRKKPVTQRRKGTKNSSVVPVKISKAMNFMEGWPTLSVNLVDMCV